jgi:hypothetical protein
MSKQGSKWGRIAKLLTSGVPHPSLASHCAAGRKECIEPHPLGKSRSMAIARSMNRQVREYDSAGRQTEACQQPYLHGELHDGELLV